MAQRNASLLAGHYFIAVEGLAMLRRFLDDPDALPRRADEIANVLADIEDFPNSLRLGITEYDIDDGYSRWAPRYDGPNPAIEAEEQPFYEMLANAPRGVALDAACGTGRHAERLAGLGYDVIGVDANTAMLDIARARLPNVEFRSGDLTALPIDDASVDVVCCALALTHVSDFAPVFAEFARVLRPGGQLLLSDMHPVMTITSGHAVFPVDDHATGLHYLPNLSHQVSSYVRAFAAAGMVIQECREPVIDQTILAHFPSQAVLPEATAQAFLGMPYLLLWRLERGSVSS
jgi:ubiquinone/menaquinone biosynthesis C-methylase UbiE